MLDVHGLNFVVAKVVRPPNRGHLSGLFIDNLWDHVVLSSPNVRDFHHVEGESSRLIRADVVRAAHNLARGETFDVIVVLKHALDGVSERDHHSQGKTFRDSHDNDDNTNDDVANPFGECVDEELFILDARGFTTEEISLTLAETFKEVTEEEYVDDKHSDVGAHLTNVGGDRLELVLEGSYFRSHN